MKWLNVERSRQSIICPAGGLRAIVRVAIPDRHGRKHYATEETSVGPDTSVRSLAGTLGPVARSADRKKPLW